MYYSYSSLSLISLPQEELGELCGKADTGQESAVWSVPDVQSGLQIVQAFNPYETITIHNELQG